MIVNCSLSQDEIYTAVSEYIQKTTGVAVYPKDVRIQVKSKQNYRAEWEEAQIKAEFSLSLARPR